MFIGWDDASVRLTGRWGRLENAAAATAPGAKIEIAFTGNWLTLHFDTRGNEEPAPRLWISVDNGNRVEAAVSEFLRIACQEDGEHVAVILFKGAVEQQSRWYMPLVGYVAFRGYEAEGRGKLPPRNRKIIEFVGDSITEGVLIDAPCVKGTQDDMLNRVYQDDVTATYAYLAARMLDLEPVFMGYGAVGVTHGGCGGVPSAPEAYPYCFAGVPVSYENVDYVLINHGTNDRHEEYRQRFLDGYERLLREVYKRHPHACVIVMVPFCGAFRESLQALVETWRQHGRRMLFVDTEGWLPAEPLHPDRYGHRIAAEKLAAQLSEALGFT